MLERELRHLGARQVVVQAYLHDREIRKDGLPYAGAKPHRPGIILSFESKHGPLSYPCDNFDDWRDNLRAIALALEALRTVDRYGVTKRGEQYRGWDALPAAGNDWHNWTASQALEYLTRFVGASGSIAERIRAAEIKSHPDRGGNPQDFKRVQKCKQLLMR